MEDPFFRLEAVLAIAEIADESSIDSLSILFEDEDAEIAETAVETVSLIGGEIAVSTLMEFLERADEKWVEHEIDYIFAIKCDLEINRNKIEIEETKYVN